MRCDATEEAFQSKQFLSQEVAVCLIAVPSLQPLGSTPLLIGYVLASLSLKLLQLLLLLAHGSLLFYHTGRPQATESQPGRRAGERPRKNDLGGF